MNISFALTTDQVRHGFATGEILKDVTRRLGWLKLRAGQRLQACRQCQGLKRGEHPEVLGTIEVVRVDRIPLWRITSEDVSREGFPGRSPEWFIEFFCGTHQPCTPQTEVTRIEFRYLTPALSPSPAAR